MISGAYALLLLTFWLVPACLVAHYATTKGRSGLGFFLLAVCFSWLLALIVALIISPDYVALEREQAARAEPERFAEAMDRKAGPVEFAMKVLIAIVVLVCMCLLLVLVRR
jgi:hypothetical protein